MKLKVFNSLFVPLAKWSMLLTRNYRCITPHEPQPIRDAVHGDLKLSQAIYEHVVGIARHMGAEAQDQVPLANTPRRRKACSTRLRRRARWPVGAPFIERVDLLVN